MEKIIEVVGGIICREDKYLLGKRPEGKSQGGCWEFIGGKIEPGETPEQALARECQEELALTIIGEKVRTSVVHAYPERTINLTLIDCPSVVHAYPERTINLTLIDCRPADGSEPQALEHSQLGWFSMKEMTALDFCAADAELLPRIFGREWFFLKWQSLSLAPTSLKAGLGKVFLEVEAPYLGIASRTSDAEDWEDEVGMAYAVDAGRLKVINEQGQPIGTYSLNPEVPLEQQGPVFKNCGRVDDGVPLGERRQFLASLVRETWGCSAELELDGQFDSTKLTIGYWLYPDQHGKLRPLIGLGSIKYDGQVIPFEDLGNEGREEKWQWTCDKTM